MRIDNITPKINNSPAVQPQKEVQAEREPDNDGDEGVKAAARQTAAKQTYKDTAVGSQIYILS